MKNKQTFYLPIVTKMAGIKFSYSVFPVGERVNLGRSLFVYP